MTLVKPQFVLASVTGIAPRRADLALYGMQLVSRGGVVWAKKAGWFRNVPYTAYEPTPMQMAVRIALGEFMREHGKGRTGVVETDIGPLPAPAAILHERKGDFNALKERWAATIGARPKTAPAKRTVHTLEELKRMARRLGRGKAPAEVIPPAIGV